MAFQLASNWLPTAFQCIFWAFQLPSNWLPTAFQLPSNWCVPTPLPKGRGVGTTLRARVAPLGPVLRNRLALVVAGPSRQQMYTVVLRVLFSQLQGAARVQRPQPRNTSTQQQSASEPGPNGQRKSENRRS